MLYERNDVGNVVSDADGMKNIWRKYMEKLLNVENYWNGDVDCPEVMGPCCLISEEEVAASIKGLKMGKEPIPTGVVSEMMKASGGFGSRWMTLSKKAVFLMNGERVFWCLCTRETVIHLCVGSTELLSDWSSQ